MLTILINESLDEKARQALIDDVVKNFGQKSKEDLWGSKSLSYPIKHQNKAFYAHFEFSSEPSSIPPLDKKLKLNEDIIRYLLLRIEAKKARKPAKPAPKKEEAKETETKE